MRVLNSSGVDVYDISTSSSTPEWLKASAAGRRKLAKEAEYRERIELIQDFSCPTSSRRIKATDDGNYVFLSGDYPPVIKCYDTRELSLKFERRVDSEIVQFEVLSEDYTKLVLLGSNRTLYFQAAYGNHYKTRIPVFGRDLCMNRQSSDLFIASSNHEVYRLNLERGQFLKSLETKSINGNEVLAHNPNLHLLSVGGANGNLSNFDIRQKPTAIINFSCFSEGFVSCVKFDEFDDLKVCLGSSKGILKYYDLRSSKPLLEKQFLNEYSINSIYFTSSKDLIIANDKKIIKVFDKNNGKVLTNISSGSTLNNEKESKNIEFNDILLYKRLDKRRKITSGLISCCCSNSNLIKSFYIPEVGTSPIWCSFLDNLIDEYNHKLDTKNFNIYDNYKFITNKELDQLGLSHLINNSLQVNDKNQKKKREGEEKKTIKEREKLLKPYMHGYFIDMKLYNNVKILLNKELLIEENKEIKKRKIKEKLNKLAGERIKPKRKRIKINKKYKLKNQNDKYYDDDDDEERVDKKEEGVDERFQEFHEDPNFEVDEESEHFKQVYTSGNKKVIKDKLNQSTLEEDNEVSESEEEEEESEKEEESDDGDDDDDDDEVKIKLIEPTEDSESEEDEDEEEQTKVWQKLKKTRSDKKEVKVKNLSNGNIEMSFIPKSTSSSSKSKRRQQ